MEPTTAADEVVGICRDLLRIDTTNTGDPRTTVGERVAAEYVAEQLAEVGIECELHESAPETGQPGRPHPRRRPLPRRAAGARPPRRGARRRERVVGAAVLRRGEGRLPVGPRRDRHEGLRRDDARRRPRLAAHRRTSRPATSCSPSPPTRRPAWSTARSSWSASTADLFEGCTEAIGEVGGFSYTVNDDLRLYLVETAEKGIDWLRLHATRPPRARLVRPRRQRGHRAGRGGRRGRPAPVPDGRHPDRAGVPRARSATRSASSSTRTTRSWPSPSSARSPT